MNVATRPRQTVREPSPHSPALPLSRSPALRFAVSLLAALATIALRLPELDRYATIDESRWVGRSADFASYVEQRDLDKTFVVGHPGVTTMWLGALGLGPERVHDFSYLEGQTDVTRRHGYLEALVAARRATLVANGLALGGMVWLAWALLGPAPALLGGLLMAWDPFLGAHSRLIHLDALLSNFIGLAVLAGLAFWSGRSWGYLALCGLFSGLAFLTKAPSVYLLACLPGLAVFEHLRTGRWRRPAGWGRLAIGLALWLGLAWAVCLALWPALRLRPLVVLRQIAEFTTRNAGGERDNFFLGQSVEDPGPLFYPLALLFRGTPLMILGLALLVYALFRWRRQLASHWPALPLLAYVIGFVLMMTLGEKKFDRYILPIFPILDLLAALGLWTALARRRVPPPRAGEGPGVGLSAEEAPGVGSSRPGVGSTSPSGRSDSGGRRPPSAVYLVLLALALWPLASTYPYYLTYYNPLLGGGAVAQRVLFVGWGEGLDQVAAYLNEKPIVLEAPTVATAYHRALQAHLRENTAMPLERAELADYIVTYVNSMQRDQNADTLSGYLAGQAPEHTVWLNGIEYARVYQGPHLPLDQAVGADVGGRARLESFVLAPGSGQARIGDELTLRLRWRASSDPASLTSVLQLAATDGRVALQDRQPLARARREAELLIVDVRLPLPATLSPGSYLLRVLLEDSATGRPLPAVGSDPDLPLRQLTLQPAAPR